MFSYKKRTIFIFLVGFGLVEELIEKHDSFSGVVDEKLIGPKNICQIDYNKSMDVNMIHLLF